MSFMLLSCKRSGNEGKSSLKNMKEGQVQFCAQEGLFHFDSIFFIRVVCGLISVSCSVGNAFSICRSAGRVGKPQV